LAFDRDADDAAATYCRRRAREILEERLRTMEESDREHYLALPWHASLVEPELRAPAVHR
jgi:hypothetical protein